MEFDKLPTRIKKLQSGEFSLLQYRDKESESLHIASYVNGFCLISVYPDGDTVYNNLNLHELHSLMLNIASISEWKGF